MKKKFVKGTVYMVRPELGKEIIAKDIANMKDMGFNIVTVWPALHWDIKKKKEDFFWIDFAVKEFEKQKVKVIIELMGQYSSMEYAPDWMVKDELRIKDFDANRYKQNVHDLNFNCPEVKKMIKSYIEIVTNHFKNMPNIYGYDIYNEHHFESFDAWTMKKFQNWLKEKYGTIESLDRVWSQTFSSFDEVTLELRFWHSIKSKVDWEMFKYDNLAQNLRFWVQTLKNIDNTKPVIADNELAMIIYDKRDSKYVHDWKTAKEVDYYGTTWYPKSSPKNLPWMWSLMFDFFRSANKGKPYLLSELQTNNYSTTRNRGVSTPQDIEMWMWRAIGFGAKGLTFWKWAPFVKAQQLGGRGLVDIDRKLSERAYAAQKVHKVIDQYHDILLNSHIDNPPVCIYYDSENKKFVDALVDLGNKKDVAHIADLSIYGWYKALYDSGIHSEFINEEELVDGILNNYKIMIIPFNFVIDQKETDAIKAFVEKGGILISEFRLGLSSKEEFTYLTTPGCGLDQVFGFHEKGLKPLGDFQIEIESSSIPAGYYNQNIVLHEKAEELGRFSDSSPAIIKNKFGEGYAYYFASSIGYAYYQNNSKEVKDLLYSIVSDDVSKNYALHILENPFRFDNILHKSDENYLLFVYNCNQENGTEKIELVLDDVKEIKNITTNKLINFSKENGKVAVNITLEAYSNTILLIN